MGRWLLLLAGFVAVAGCASSNGGDSARNNASFNDLPVQVSASTGAIRGVVVDDRIVPVVGAQLGLAGAALNQSSVTDAEGRFAFGNLQPGTYFLTATAPFHKSTQTSVDVVAGEEPPVTRLQLERLYKQAPYVVQIKQDGFFECSQNGASVWYSSSTCADGVFGPAANLYPPLSNVTQQNREWHADVLPGWQEMVIEMEWQPTAQGTSDTMAITLSTYKPTRDGAHWFAHVESTSPMRFQLDVGVEHETASGVDPTMVPPEGMPTMSYFVSVGTPSGATCVFFCAPPGLALNQQFSVFLHQFYYGVPPEGWSFLNGDPLPF